MQTIPLSPALGAEVRGVDIGRLDGPAFAALHAAFLRHQVLFFREQRLTSEQHLAFAGRFGTPDRHPMMRTLDAFPEILEIIKGPEDRNNFGGDWHTDLSYLAEPASVSVLVAREVPAAGGDTLFASMYRAYETLSEGMREALDGLRAVHTTSKVYHAAAQSAGIIGDAQTMQRTRPDAEQEAAEHPVVRIHPETGGRALYVNEVFTERFVGMTREESRPWLELLWRHAAKPEHTCRFRWTAGSVAVWDNRCTQHYALNDYGGHRRVMHRVSVHGRPEA